MTLMTLTTSTHWTTLIGPARQGSIAALANVYRRYTPFMRAYLVLWRAGTRRVDPEDLLHDFYLDRLPAVLASADRERGRFRNLLLKALQLFLLERIRRQSALKRGELVTGPLLDEPMGTSNPELEYERAWVRLVRERAMGKLREFVVDCAAQRSESIDLRLLHTIEDDLREAERGEYSQYRTLASELELSVDVVKKRAQRLRQRYHALVRAEIEHTLQAVAGVEPT